jgi:hypothetical protein
LSPIFIAMLEDIDLIFTISVYNDELQLKDYISFRCKDI